MQKTKGLTCATVALFLVIELACADIAPSPQERIIGGGIILGLLSIPVVIIAFIAFLIIRWIKKKHVQSNQPFKNVSENALGYNTILK